MMKAEEEMNKMNKLQRSWKITQINGTDLFTFQNLANGKFMASDKSGNLGFKTIDEITNKTVNLNLKRQGNFVQSSKIFIILTLLNVLKAKPTKEQDEFLILNNDLLPKYKLKSKCNWFSIVKMNKKRSKLENKLRISRFDSKNGLFLFDPLNFHFINLKENKPQRLNSNSYIKCHFLYGIKNNSMIIL